MMQQRGPNPESGAEQAYLSITRQHSNILLSVRSLRPSAVPYTLNTGEKYRGDLTQQAMPPAIPRKNE